MIQFELSQNNASIIKVIGVGGGGGNAVNYMYGLGIEGVDFIVCNTDKKALNNSTVPTKIQLGPALTQGLGAGANPEIGMKACQESINEVQNLLANNTKMVFVTAGMGGGTGTGGAPVVASIAKELGILTVGIVTTPFSYEGKRRMKQAEEGIANLRKYVDTILIISNDKLRHQFGNIPASQAFSRADDILATATKCITDVINSQGHIVVDFADVSTVMRDGGVAILGSATAKGENRAYDAVEQAINSPLLNDNQITGAKWVLLNINSAHGIYEHTLDEVEIIQAYVQEQAGDDCDVIFGTGFDDNLGENISVTVIATGFQLKSMDNAYDKEHKKPYHDKNKVLIPLHDDDNKENNDTNTSYESTLNNPVVNDTNNIQMIDIEQPAIPNTLALGMLMKASVKIENEQDVVQQEKILMSLETEEIQIEQISPAAAIETQAPIDENVQAELDKLFEAESNKQSEHIAMVEKTETEMQNDFVTIKGITLSRRKGNRLMTDMELEAEANFELQKRALEERAAKLRSMSFDVNKAGIEESDSNVPAFQRRNIALEEHPDSQDDTYSDIRVTQNNGNSNISTLNSFLNGKNPD